jgi:hypothetical protein
MESRDFKEEVLNVTLRGINLPPNEWVTYNDKLNSRIIKDNSEVRSNFELIDNELVIFECCLPNNFFVVSTSRLLINFESNNYSIRLKDIVGFSPDYEKENNTKIDGRRLPKTNLLVARDNNADKYKFEVDSYYPAYFVKLLIKNASSFLRSGKWYLNPRSFDRK